MWHCEHSNYGLFIWVFFANVRRSVDIRPFLQTVLVKCGLLCKNNCFHPVSRINISPFANQSVYYNAIFIVVIIIYVVFLIYLVVVGDVVPHTPSCLSLSLKVYTETKHGYEEADIVAYLTAPRSLYKSRTHTVLHDTFTKKKTDKKKTGHDGF